MQVTILGNICIDNNLTEQESYISLGSPCFFISKIFQKSFHILPTIISSYGLDLFKYFDGDLNLFPKKPTNKFTLVYKNIVINGKRTQKVNHLNCAKNIIPINFKLKKILKNTDIFFFAPLTPYYKIDYLKKIIVELKKNSLKIFLPQGYLRKFNKKNEVLQRNFYEDEIVSFFDFVIVSQEDHKNILKLVKRWSKKVKVILTLAEEGSAFYHKEKYFHQKVKKVEIKDIVDSIGAGDIFSAGFAYQFYLTKNIKKSLKFANNVARESLFYSSKDL